MSKANTQSEVLTILRREMPALREQFGVEKIAVYGSFAKGNPTAGSDVDILVSLSKPLGFGFIRLANHLEDQLGRKVDLATFNTLNSPHLNRRRAHITEEIKRTMIYA